MGMGVGLHTALHIQGDLLKCKSVLLPPQNLLWPPDLHEMKFRLVVPGLLGLSRVYISEMNREHLQDLEDEGFHMLSELPASEPLASYTNSNSSIREQCQHCFPSP